VGLVLTAPLLALIALPNLLEAQVRSKVTRAKADLRTINTGLEAYMVDHNRYPPNQEFHGTLHGPDALSTPIGYLASIPHDPFRVDQSDERLQRYEYHNVKQRVQEKVPNWPPNDLVRYGDWRLTSLGPMRQYLPWMPYDPTNGTVSEGNILRTQRSPEGKILYTYWDPSNPQD
jgi:type II secretory pathway pseudopilin PulG